MDATNGEPKESADFWITNDYFIRLDKNGCTLDEDSDTLQGALGYVIKLYNKSLSNSGSNGDKEFLALKIPKLHGETHRENAYIAGLMQREVEVVEKVGFRAMPGLLKSEKLSLEILRQPITARDHKDFHDKVILVIYKRGNNPYFMRLPVEDNDKLHGDDEFNQILQLLKGKSTESLQKQTKSWKDTLVIYKGSSVQNGWQISEQPELAGLESTDVVAYICLPAVIYEWIDGTLQYAISRNKRVNWSVQDHLKLTRQICSGVDALHQEGFIHADIRPSNIAYKTDFNDPTDYFIIDYGSLAAKPPGGSPNGSLDQQSHPEVLLVVEVTRL